MNILSRYILGKFIQPFLASFVGLCILVMFSQVVERLDRFMADGVSMANVFGYLVTSLPFQAMNILPVACLLATLFVVGNLVRTREYIAGLAGGVAPEKFLGGILVAGLGLTLMAFVLNETVVPPATEYSRRVFREKIRRLGEWRQTVFSNIVVLGADGRVWNARQFNEETGTMTRVVVDKFLDGKLGNQVDALTATHTPEGWVFQTGVVRNFAQNEALISEIEPFNERLFEFSEKPTDLIIQEPQPEQMNYRKLKDHVQRLSALGVPVRKLEVELMMKLSFPFVCFIVTLLGVPLAMQGRGSRAMGIAAGCALTLAYMGFMQFGKAMAQRLIPVWLGAWMGNIFFAALAAYLWWRLRRFN